MAVETGSSTASAAPPRTRAALAVIAGAQLMITLDSTITNIALPSIQLDLQVAAANLPWIVTAYALAFGGLLLLGGRAGDLFGRRRVFRFGVITFTLASLLGGLAPNALVLILARLLQGVGAAVAAPNALAMIATSFPEGRARTKAMGIYAAMPPLGSTIGLLLGGALTEFLHWRWVMFVNVPIGLAILLGSYALSPGERGNSRLDVPGAITATLGMTSLVYAVTRGEIAGWTDGITLGCFATAAVLIAVFLLIQYRSPHPMMPLRLLRDRNRSGAYATMLFVGTGMLSTYYFLTLYMQQVLGINALQAGFSYLPFALSIGASSWLLGPRLLKVLAPRLVTGTGLVLAASGMVSFSALNPGSPYAAHLMPTMMVTGLGLGLCFVPMTMGAVRGVAPQETGIASALLNAAMQVGGAVGLSVLSTIAAATAASELPQANTALTEARRTGDAELLAQTTEALTSGYTTVFGIAAGLYAIALVIVLAAVNVRRSG